MLKNVTKKQILRTVFVTLICGVLIYANYQKERKTVYEKLYIQIDNPEETVEYGTNYALAKRLVPPHYGELTQSGVLNPYEVGDYEVTYTLTGKDATFGSTVERSFTKVFHVVDTQAPIIQLEAEKVIAYIGSEYDFKTKNIISVQDPVDGIIEDENIQIVTEANLEEVGDYEVKVVATDENGNSSEASYILQVRRRPNVVTNSNYYYILDKLKNTYGYNDAACAGILANMKYECTFDPTCETPKYYGLIQWGGGRRTNLYNYCAEHGLAYDSIDGQLAFMQHELTTSYRRVYNFLTSVENTAQGAYDAGAYFCNKYEGAARLSGRADLAIAYFNLNH